VNIQLSFFDLLVLIGITTGIICSIVLLRKSKLKKSNKYLALGILSFVWLNTKILLHSFNLWQVHGFGFFPNGVELAIPPLFYLYMMSIVNPTHRFVQKKWIYFIPFFISQLYSIIVYLTIMQTKVYVEKQAIAQRLFFDLAKNIDEYLLIIFSIIYFYIFFTSNTVKSYYASKSSKTHILEAKFLRNISILLVTLSSVHVLNLVLNKILDSSYNWRWNLNSVLISAAVYYMAIIGFKNADILKKNKRKDIVIDNDIIQKLHQAITIKKVYLNPKLTLQELAKDLNINESILSNTINSYYQKNFRKVLNEARVEEVKNRLLNGELENLSLLGIAKESGFNSEASFYRIFKSETQITPKQFISKNLNLQKST